MKIRTSTNYAPRSMGDYLWAAWDDENDGDGCLIGLGDTQEEAMDELLFKNLAACFGVVS